MRAAPLKACFFRDGSRVLKEENGDDLAPYDAANSCRAIPLVKEANQHHPHSTRQG
jgi:hypothetical protein